MMLGVPSRFVRFAVVSALFAPITGFSVLGCGGGANGSGQSYNNPPSSDGGGVPISVGDGGTRDGAPAGDAGGPASDARAPGSDAAGPGSDAGGPGSSPDGSSSDGMAGSGAPITGQDGVWTWVPFPNSHCRDGSNAGISVNLESKSNKVVIYMQGGGACFDSSTCGINPANTSGQQTPSAAGLLDRTNSMNPVGDWNWIYVPYCTGDIHAGANPNGTVSGVSGTQMFVGYTNMQAFLERIVATFPNASQVLLTGISAGGFGAAVDAPLVQHAFPNIKVALIDDSGPPMSDMNLPACLQHTWQTTWGFDKSILKECGSDCSNSDDFVLDYMKHVAKLYGDRMSGIIDSSDDSVISAFFGFGQNNCTGSLLTPVPSAAYTQGLTDLRTAITGVDSKFGVYIPDGTQHTWLGGASLYTEAQGGTSLIGWVTNIVSDMSIQQVGP